MNEPHATPSVPSNEIRSNGIQDEAAVTEQSLIETEDLIEEISIDGMCGVY